MIRSMVTVSAIGAALMAGAPPASAADTGPIVWRTPQTQRSAGAELLQRSQRRAAGEAATATVRAVQRATGTSSFGRLITGVVRDATRVGQRTMNKR